MLISVRVGAFQRHKVDLLLWLVASTAAARARRRRLPRLRRAQQAVQSGLLCILTVYLPTHTGSCLVAAVRRCKGGDGRGERGRARHLFEVTEIATTDDKMLMEEMLNNTTW